MAAIIKEQAFDTLRDSSFAAFRPVRLQVTDRAWQHIVGFAIAIPGGCEIEIDGGRLDALIAREREGLLIDLDTAPVPVIIRDPYFPAIECTVHLRALRFNFNQIEQGAGPRRRMQRRRCTHRPSDPPALCEYCFWRWAREKRAEQGVASIEVGLRLDGAEFTVQ